MLFVKKTKPSIDGKTDPKLDVIDVIDVTDVTPLTEAVAPTTEEDVSSAGASAARGVFLDAKPAAATQPTGKGLRDRFLRTGPPAPLNTDGPQSSELKKSRPWAVKVAAKDKPLAETESPMPATTQAASEGSSRFSWLARKDKAAPVPPVAAPAEPVADAGPIGPTEKVRKPIIVRKASDKKKKFQELPIRVFMGYLPEVSERDARDFALGIAERNCEQISLVYYDAFKMNDGYGYEVHEGGSGRAYLPEIIEHFAAQGPFEKGGAEASVFIRTATRMVQVERTHDGLQAFQLPESAAETASDWLEGSTKMTAAIQTMTSVLVVGAALFTTGFLAMALAMVSRIQTYEPAPQPAIERATDGFNLSPLSRWTTLQGVSGEEYVKALRFTKGKWELDRGTAPAAPVAAPDTATTQPAATN